MVRRTLISAALLVAVIALTDHATADEMQVTSSDATSRFMALGVSKEVVIDLSTDIKNMVVADRGIVSAVAVSSRRVYIIGAALGQTNVYFFAADGRQIGALDIAVTSTSEPASLENYTQPANVVLVYRYGVGGENINCTPIKCIDANKPGANQVPGTQNINVSGNATTVVPVR